MNNQYQNDKIRINLLELEREVNEFLDLCSKVDEKLKTKQHSSESLLDNKAKFGVASADEFCYEQEVDK